MSAVELQIDPKWCDRVRGLPFLYPCAGNDTASAIEAFCGICEPILFVDKATVREPRIPEGFLVERVPPQNHSARPVSVDPRQHQRHREWHATAPDGRFGLVAYTTADAEEYLRNMPPRSIGVFMHVGDNPPGEGGSGMHFLSSTVGPRGGIPLLDVLLEKLADQALVISDGSNSDLSMRGEDKRYFSAVSSIGRAGFIFASVGKLSGRRVMADIYGFERVVQVARE